MPGTKQQRKRKRDNQQGKSSTGNKTTRFLNMSPKQVKVRYHREKHKEYRKAGRMKTKTSSSVLRKARPCCGLVSKKCVCTPPVGMRKSELNKLCRRFAKTALCTVQDTTDVSTFQTLMAKRCEKVPLQVLLAYAHTHVVFNQDELLSSFIEQKAFLFKAPWFNWELLRRIVEKAKRKGQAWRSSNYRSTTLREIRVPRHMGKPVLLQSKGAVERAVLQCRVIGEDAMPGACLAEYERSPSRGLWKASMLSWLEQVQSKCSGAFNHYYLKCSLDRAFAVRTFSPATISWWPTECPSYLHWYELLYPERSLTTEEKFQVLCTTYIALNQKRNCSIPEALAQTCWLKMEKDGKLHVGEDN